MTSRVEELQKKYLKVTDQARNCRKRKLNLESNVCELKLALKDMKSELSDKAYDDVLNKASGLPESVFKLYQTKLRKVETEDKTYYPGQSYSEEIRKFSLTLFGYSKKAYEYVRESLDKVLPAVSTIQTWLNKVDSSPGFSDQVLNQLCVMAREKEMLGQKVN